MSEHTATSVESINIPKHSGKVYCTVTPPSSKSESNRVLIMEALTGKNCYMGNLSNARDTQTMIRLLNSDDYTLDVLDAGTTMRFLTAYCAVSERERELTGTARMKERPIKLLVDALRELGANIEYKEKEGYPPIVIKPFDTSNPGTNHIKIKGDVSSQYITALIMIAPVLPEGLVIELEGKVGSKPYIRMTLRLMELFGISSSWEDNIIRIPNKKYEPFPYKVESDWSAASYWYSIAALSNEAEIKLNGYLTDSFQGDRVVADIMDKLGVKSTFTPEGVILTKKEAVSSIEFDYTDCPDLAQTIAVICAAKGIECTMSGLESLRIKETDRIAALQNELAKFGARMLELVPDQVYKVITDDFVVNGQSVATYKDHRMAMAFAPLALLGPVTIENPDVVEKSYPHYWEDLKKAGFAL
ncbi:MAG TPA: 3-phosphoshikimate 1-carboxyvinyltransferase [Cytophagaceae bacterium]